MVDIKDLSPDTIINGKFRIIEPVGQGWNSLYYMAEQLDLNRIVVLKIIRPENKNAEGLKKLFLTSACLMAGLEHPNIVPIYELGDYEDRPFLTMRYLEHGSIRKLLWEHRVISLGEKFRILTEIAEALDYAHSKNVIHADVKPANIILEGVSRVVCNQNSSIDF